MTTIWDHHLIIIIQNLNQLDHHFPPKSQNYLEMNSLRFNGIHTSSSTEFVNHPPSDGFSTSVKFVEKLADASKFKRHFKNSITRKLNSIVLAGTRGSYEKHMLRMIFFSSCDPAFFRDFFFLRVATRILSMSEKYEKYKNNTGFLQMTQLFSGRSDEM